MKRSLAHFAALAASDAFEGFNPVRPGMIPREQEEAPQTSPRQRKRLLARQARKQERRHRK